jgi:hypothetical protein
LSGRKLRLEALIGAPLTRQRFSRSDPTAMEESDRRRDTRARISLPTHVVRRGGMETVEMLDASYRGLFVRMDNPPPERELVKLVVELPGDGEMEVHAVVVRLVVDPVGRCGVGLRFFALNGQERSAWESFISSLINRRAKAA